MRIRATDIRAAAALVAALCTTGAPVAAQSGSSKASGSNPAPSSGSATSIGVRVGTLGIGLELSHLLSDHIGLRVGGNYFSQNRTQNVESTNYAATAKVQSFTGLLDWYLGRRGAFHFSAGAVSNALTLDGVGIPSPGVPAGRRCVEDTKRYIKRTSFKSGLLAILAVVSSSVPFINVFSSRLKYAAKSYVTVMMLMYAVDWAWRDAFSGNAPSDGVVPMTSQRWNGANDERVITAADSHVGSTKSNFLRVPLTSLLQSAAQ